jgi:hypothetical protein
MNHLGPEECPLCWRFDCKCWAAIADRNPQGGDVKQAPSRSDESGGAGTAIAQTPPPHPISRTT